MLLIGLLLPIYSSSLTSSWQMDDRPNILNNSRLHLKDLMPESLWQTFFTNQGRIEKKLFRPLPSLTLGLNWYFNGNNPFGYHLVNLGLHILTAWILYRLFFLLLVLFNPKARACCFSENHAAAVLAAIFWAINPIQIQAVTYIVQRMAVMAGLSYAAGLLAYVKFRTASGRGKQWYWGTACILCFFCGLGSKENAVMLPFSMLLMEWIFFQGGRMDFLYRPKFWFFAVPLSIMGLWLVLSLTNGSPLQYLRGSYGSRPFTLEERLLTQPRVLLGYLSQIFYPLPKRFSIAHDVTVSVSLFHPWATLPSILAVFGMIGGAIFLARRRSIIAFAVLFFFLNHAVESTVFPLELVFEHRNYLPSFFLFLPLSVGLQRVLIELGRAQRHFLQVGIATATISVVIAIGLGTYTRNLAWATDISLWSDAVSKAPNNIRPLATLAIKLAWQEHPSPTDYRRALNLFQRTLDLTPASRIMERAETLGNMAAIHFLQGENQRAIAIYRQAMELDPDFLKHRSDLVKPLIITGQFEEALHHAAYLVDRQPDNPDYLNLQGMIYLWQNRPAEALPCFQHALAKDKISPAISLNMGLALTRLAHFKNGRWFCQRAIGQSPHDLDPWLALIENRSRAGDENKAEYYAQRLVGFFPVAIIVARLKDMKSDYRNAPLSFEHIASYVENALQASVNSIPIADK